MLKDKINEEIKSAMKARDQVRVGTLRMVFSAIKDFEINNRVTAEDKDVITVLRKAVKTRQDAIAEFQKGGRQDLVEKEDGEIKIIEEFLPPPVDIEEIKRVVTEVIETTGASSMKDMGRVMKECQIRFAGAVEGGTISGIVRELLGKSA